MINKWAATKPTTWLCAQRRLRSARGSSWHFSYHTPYQPETIGFDTTNESLATHWAHSEDWSDWADAQADLSLRWAHTHFVGFVMSRLICRIKPYSLGLIWGMIRKMSWRSSGWYGSLGLIWGMEQKYHIKSLLIKWQLFKKKYHKQICWKIGENNSEVRNLFTF